MRIYSTRINMIVAPLRYVWENTPPPVHVVSIPVFISALKFIPKDVRWHFV